MLIYVLVYILIYLLIYMLIYILVYVLMIVYFETICQFPVFRDPTYCTNPKDFKI